MLWTNSTNTTVRSPVWSGAIFVFFFFLYLYSSNHTTGARILPHRPRLSSGRRVPPCDKRVVWAGGRHYTKLMQLCHCSLLVPQIITKQKNLLAIRLNNKIGICNKQNTECFLLFVRLCFFFFRCETETAKLSLRDT